LFFWYFLSFEFQNYEYLDLEHKHGKEKTAFQDGWLLGLPRKGALVLRLAPSRAAKPRRAGSKKHVHEIRNKESQEAPQKVVKLSMLTHHLYQKPQRILDQLGRMTPTTFEKLPAGVGRSEHESQINRSLSWNIEISEKHKYTNSHSTRVFGYDFISGSPVSKE